MNGAFQIRLATAGDLAAINAIYNYYVAHSTCTYQEVAETELDRANWFHRRTPAHPVTVAVTGGIVIGWASLSVWNPRSAYRRTAEASVYLHHERLGKGLGKAMLADLIQRARDLGYHCIIGGASADQTASLRLQASLGFQQVGHMREVGFKFGRWLDVIYTQLML